MRTADTKAGPSAGDVYGGCLFCRIARREIPADVVYEDDRTLAFRDINPQAPIHVLVIPKRHVSALADLREEDEGLAGHVLVVAAKLASTLGAEGGFRVVGNCGELAGQSVFHIHFHLLGGRRFGWPPG
ncbi:MAG: histidine triad nucleotide-binding protein [Firmicutes bacterium]|jgi:histidine triad (HIT) family protein|nr:histidine triad nucleotide-binding protein [Bacillota bacterium]MDH7495013.1 histidine triad nucleotide-binding protein [Bacillota bacterium]